MSAFADVLARPASLEARRALLGEWQAAGNPRAQLLELQLAYWELARQDDDASPRANKLREQAFALIRTSGASWAGSIAKQVDRYAFHRGLVAELWLSVDAFVEHAAELCAAAPIQHLNLTGPITRWAELCALPQLDQIVALEVVRATDLADAQATTLAKSRHASGLRWLALTGCSVGRPGVEALAASPYLDRLAYLGLRDNPCDPTPSVYNDESGPSVTPSPLGLELQRTYGPRTWLAGPPPARADHWPPDRDTLAAS